MNLVSNIRLESSNSKSSERIFGLDLLRSIAIILVVLGHSISLIENYFKKVSAIEIPDGVDLFFVLSGYLIGMILIKTIERNPDYSLLTVLNFLKRRWFRTLPNYFLFLFINIILFKESVGVYIRTYFFFFQNFYKHYDGIFWESWSLSVEEWFYLLFPIVLLILFRITRHKVIAKRLVLSVIVSFLILPLIYRIHLSDLSLDIGRSFRTLVLTRLDTIGFGLLAAYLHTYNISFWNKSKNILFILGVTMYIFIAAVDLKNVFFLQTFYFSLIGFSILLIIPKLVSLKNERIHLKPFQFISNISYSMYLVHLPLIYIISTKFNVLNIFQSMVVYVFYWIMTLVISYIIYRFYEKPMMNLREKSFINVLK